MGIEGVSVLLAAVLVAPGMAMVAFWVGLPGSREAFEVRIACRECGRTYMMDARVFGLMGSAFERWDWNGMAWRRDDTPTVQDLRGLLAPEKNRAMGYE